MVIHTVSNGETLLQISEKYGISEKELARLNGIKEHKFSVGEELLILIPTRVHRARPGDSIERLCLRYKIRKNDILAYNPRLCNCEPCAGDEIALKYDEQIHGMAAANGYIYNGTTMSALKCALPYMTYTTFATHTANEAGLRKVFDESELLKEAIGEGKIPLMRVCYDSNKSIRSLSVLEDLTNKMIAYAKGKGYKGIVLNASSQNNSADIYCRFLMNFKKQIIGEDLILITECDENSPKDFNEIADGSIFSYTKLWKSPLPSFSDGEGKAIADFACECESIKSFVELPSFGKLGEEYIEITKAKDKIRELGGVVSSDKNSMTESFMLEGNNCVIPTLSNIKAVLELLSEYGYMGISFDVMRTPRAFLMMYNAMFKTVCATVSNSREGCSRELNA